jgi:hypothetical protein
MNEIPDEIRVPDYSGIESILGQETEKDHRQNADRNKDTGKNR